MSTITELPSALPLITSSRQFLDLSLIHIFPAHDGGIRTAKRDVGCAVGQTEGHGGKLLLTHLIRSESKIAQLSLIHILPPVSPPPEPPPCTGPFPAILNRWPESLV